MPDFVFIGGPGHSGTTLLTAIMGAHPLIYSIPIETYAFRRELPDTEIRKMLEELAAQSDKPNALYVCEKTPAHIRKADQISTLYPKAKFVFMVRDPRDVIASFRRRGVTFEAAVNNCSRAYRSLLKAEGKHDFCKLYFEDLVARPEHELERVCDYLGIQFEPVMLEYWKSPRGWQGVTELRKPDSPEGKKNHRLYRNWQIHQPIMKDRVGNFHNLTVDELAYVETELASLSEKIGYKMRSKPSRVAPANGFGL